MTTRHDRGRRSIRLSGYDYRARGMYFVTICTQHGEHTLGTIRHGIVGLSDEGCIVAHELQKTPILRPTVHLDTWIIMPNHLHILFCIDDDRAGMGIAGADGGAIVGADGGAIVRAPCHGAPTSHPLGFIIGRFKSAATARINALHDAPHGTRVWQRNFYEHIVRSPEECDRIRAYIRRNPSRSPHNNHAIG